MKKNKKFKKNNVMPNIGEIWSVNRYDLIGFQPDVIAFKCKQVYRRKNTIYYDLDLIKGKRNDVPPGTYWSKSKSFNWDTTLSLIDLVTMKNEDVISKSDEVWLAKKLLEEEIES